LGVATNDTEASAFRHVEALGHSRTFDFIAGYNSGHGAKPEPGMILAFSQAIALTLGEIAMVGDSLHDMHAGRAAGVTSIAVTTGPAKRETLAPAADFVIDSLSELPDLISELNA
jgi:phosphoglycolate phosphatase